jgi:hypothetical protein
MSTLKKKNKTKSPGAGLGGSQLALPSDSSFMEAMFGEVRSTAGRVADASGKEETRHHRVRKYTQYVALLEAQLGFWKAQLKNELSMEGISFFWSIGSERITMLT